MPQAVVFRFALHAPLCREHRASVARFVVARTFQPLAIAVNHCCASSVADRTSAFASRPVARRGQAAGSAAGLGWRQLLRPSRLPSGFSCVVFTSSLEAGARASLGQRVPVSLRQ